MSDSFTSSQSAAGRATFGDALVEVSLDGAESADIEVDVDVEDSDLVSLQAIVELLRSRGFLLSD